MITKEAYTNLLLRTLRDLTYEESESHLLRLMYVAHVEFTTLFAALLEIGSDGSKNGVQVLIKDEPIKDVLEISTLLSIASALKHRLTKSKVMSITLTEFGFG